MKEDIIQAPNIPGFPEPDENLMDPLLIKHGYEIDGLSIEDKKYLYIRLIASNKKL